MKESICCICKAVWEDKEERTLYGCPSCKRGHPELLKQPKTQQKATSKPRSIKNSSKRQIN